MGDPQHGKGLLHHSRHEIAASIRENFLWNSCLREDGDQGFSHCLGVRLSKRNGLRIASSKIHQRENILVAVGGASKGPNQVYCHSLKWFCNGRKWHQGCSLLLCLVASLAVWILSAPICDVSCDLLPVKMLHYLLNRPSLP